MGRLPHIHYEGAVYHVTARGVRQMPVFGEEGDKRELLRIVEHTRSRFGFKLLAYCVMSNHLHFLIKVGGVSLSRVMQVVLARYSARFNRKTSSGGHAFEERFFRRLVRDDAYLGVVVRYIHGNPVAAGMVSRAEDWPWSSSRQYKANEGGIADIACTRELFGDDEAPVNLYEAVLELGDEAYIPRRAPCFDEPESPCPNLDKILLDVVRGTPYTPADLRGSGRRGKIPSLRAEFFRRAVFGGARNIDAARFLGKTEARVTAALGRVTKERNP